MNARQTLGTARGTAAVILGLLGAAVLAFGILVLVSALAPGAGMAAMGILFAPWLIVGGGLGIASALGVWRDQATARVAGGLFSVVLGAAMGAAGLGALRIAQGHPPTEPCVGPVAAKCAAAATDVAPPPPDFVVAALFLGAAALCVATLVLLVLAWRSAAAANSSQAVEPWGMDVSREDDERGL